jgi:thiamine biosynthesis lipoprotein
MRNLQQQVMGTVVSFSLREARSTTTDPGATAAEQREARERVDEALARAQAELRWVDDVFSTWKPQSPVSRLRRGEIRVEDAPPEVAEVLELCRTAREASDGWFDPWALPGGVDPTGLVKGWAAQRALGIIKEAGAPAAMVNAGGDIAMYGQPAPGQTWRVGIQHPVARDRILLTADLAGAGAVATSGSYERGEHIIDPRTGEPTAALLSATVIGHDLGYADALATALYASRGELLERISLLIGYHGFIVDGRGNVRASRGFPIMLEGVEAVPA